MFHSIPAVPEPRLPPPPDYVSFSGGIVGLSPNMVPWSEGEAECASITATFYSATSETDFQDCMTALASIPSKSQTYTYI